MMVTADGYMESECVYLCVCMGVCLCVCGGVMGLIQ